MKKYVRFSAFILSVLILISSLYITPYAADISSGDFIFTQSGKNLTLKKYVGKGGTVTVPSAVNGKKVTAVGNQAFAEYYEETPDSKRITKVILPATVTSIGKQAFQECTKLSAVEMIGVKSLGDAAFWYCKGLKKLATSSSLKTIGVNAFGKCSSLKIYCESGSAAQEYAKKNAIAYAPLYPSKITLSKSSVTIEKGRTVKLTVKTTPSDVYYKEYNWYMLGTNATVSQSGTVKGKKIGTDAVCCVSVFGDASAECFVSVKMPSPKSFSVSKTKFDSLTLTWKKASGAKGYILETERNCKWVRLADTKSLSCTVTGLSEKTEYKFRIRAYSKQNDFTINSDWVKLTAKTLSLTKVKNVKPKSYFYDELSFSWSKVSHASGYEVYSIDSKGKSKKIKTTEKTSFNDKDLSDSVIKKYKVRAYANVGKKKVYGSYSDSFTFATKPSKVTKLTVSGKTKNSVSLKWNKVKNASGYIVYRYDAKNDKYTSVKKLKATEYTVTGLNPSTKYTYSVMAYINTTLKTTYGDYSSNTSVTTAPLVLPEEAAVKSLSTAFGKLKNEKSLYVSLTSKTQLSVSSCTGNSKQRALANAYAGALSTSKVETFEFENGKDIYGLTPGDRFIPGGGFSLKTSSIKSVSKMKDGSGYNLGVTLKSETSKSGSKPAINSGVWGMIDFNDIKEKISEDAVLKTLTIKYTGTVINTKINSSSAFDTLTVTVPFEAEAVCTVGSDEVKTVFTGKLVRDYIFVRW